jgi:hypothetical protein
MTLKTIAEVRLTVPCNWCRNTLDTSEVMTESNFVNTGKTFPSDSSTAYALFCNECLASAFRTSQPKSAVNRNTLYESDLAEL